MKKLLQGRSPYNVSSGQEEGAEFPSQFCSWLDPLAHAFLDEASLGGRRRKNRQTVVVCEGAALVARRPLWTIETRERLVQQIEVLARRELGERQARVRARVARPAIDEASEDDIPQQFSLSLFAGRAAILEVARGEATNGG